MINELQAWQVVKEQYIHINQNLKRTYETNADWLRVESVSKQGVYNLFKTSIGTLWIENVEELLVFTIRADRPIGMYEEYEKALVEYVWNISQYSKGAYIDDELNIIPSYRPKSHLASACGSK